MTREEFERDLLFLLQAYEEDFYEPAMRFLDKLTSFVSDEYERGFNDGVFNDGKELQ